MFPHYISVKEVFEGVGDVGLVNNMILDFVDLNVFVGEEVRERENWLNFINVLRTAFTLADPESVKR